MNRRTTWDGITCLLAWMAALPAIAPAAEKRVDNPVDVWMIAQTGPGGQAVEGAWNRRPGILDTTDVKAGDFAVAFGVGDPAKESAFGFCPGPFIEHWTVSRDHALHLWVRAAAEPAPQAWSLALYDTQSKRATAALSGMAADGKWREFTLPLKGLKADDGFNFGAVRAVQVEAALPKDARLWLDDVYFKNGDAQLGISDKTITQYMAEAASTRQKRVEAALGGGHWAPGQGQAAALYAGRDLEKTNQGLITWFEKEMKDAGGSWSLHTTTALNMLYFGYSSNGRIKPGRLSPERPKRSCSNSTGNTVSTRILSYRGCGKDAPLIEFNAANNEIPTVDGMAVNYDCPTFDSPWLKGEAGSGVVTITAPTSGKKLVLDFNKIERREEDEKK